MLVNYLQEDNTPDIRTENPAKDAMSRMRALKMREAAESTAAVADVEGRESIKSRARRRVEVQQEAQWRIAVDPVKSALS